MTWEAVLAEVEDDVLRTEALLRSVKSPAGELRLGPLAPAETMLPGGLPTGMLPRLPDPRAMPEPPTELISRVRTLQARLAQVGDELQAALLEVGDYLAAPAPREMTVFPSRPAPPPRFVDRAL